MKWLRKQGQSRIVRIILILVALVSALSTHALAQSPGLHFISVAWIPPEKQAQYDAFSAEVTSIWKRHGMKALLRAKVVGALAGEDVVELPTEIAVLSVASRADFENYIADPDYRAIRPQRMDAVSQMIVLEGTPLEPAPLFQTAPQFAMTFSAGEWETIETKPAFQMQVALAGSIKGNVPQPYAAKPNIGLFALSYDDNPMSFVADASSRFPVLILQRVAD